jgi:hypothetical protein
MVKLADMEIATRIAYRLEALRNLRRHHEQFPQLELSVRLIDKSATGIHNSRPGSAIAAFEIHPAECIPFLDNAEREMIAQLEALGVTDTSDRLIRTRGR